MIAAPKTDNARAIAHLFAIVETTNAEAARAGRPPLDTDALFASFRAHGDMIPEPAPSVEGYARRVAARWDADDVDAFEAEAPQ